MPVEPVVAAVVPVVLEAAVVPVVPEALAALDPCSLAVAVLVVHNEHVELMSRQWFLFILHGAEEACYNYGRPVWDQVVRTRM